MSLDNGNKVDELATDPEDSSHVNETSRDSESIMVSKGGENSGNRINVLIHERVLFFTASKLFYPFHISQVF